MVSLFPYASACGKPKWWTPVPRHWLKGQLTGQILDVYCSKLWFTVILPSGQSNDSVILSFIWSPKWWNVWFMVGLYHLRFMGFNLAGQRRLALWGNPCGYNSFTHHRIGDALELLPQPSHFSSGQLEGWILGDSGRRSGRTWARSRPCLPWARRLGAWGMKLLKKTYSNLMAGEILVQSESNISRSFLSYCI